MQPINWTMSLLLFFTLANQGLYAQAAASRSKPERDVLVFTDGEKMIGHLERATDSSVVFTSDMVGEVTVDWSKIQELRSSQKFAAMPKDVKLRRSEDANTVPQGTVTMTDQKIQVKSDAQARSQVIPIGNVGNLVDETSFQNAFRKQSFTQGWKGGATAGLSLTQAPQYGAHGGPYRIRKVVHQAIRNNSTRLVCFCFRQTVAARSNATSCHAENRME
jgi:hypothetical protein